MALHLPPGAVVNVFLSSVPISNLGIVTRAGVWATAVAAQVRKAERCDTWTHCHRCATSGWLLGTLECRAAYRLLCFGYWCICPGGGDHLCKLMNDRGVGFGFAEWINFLLCTYGE